MGGLDFTRDSTMQTAMTFSKLAPVLVAVIGVAACTAPVETTQRSEQDLGSMTWGTPPDPNGPFWTYFSGTAVLGNTYNCPDVHVPNGWLLGAPGHRWLVATRQTSDQLMAVNHWLTMDMITQVTPFCIYNYQSMFIPLDQQDPLAAWHMRSAFGAVRTELAVTGVEMKLEPHHTGCASCGNDEDAISPKM